jgi:hypothetical protein
MYEKITQIVEDYIAKKPEEYAQVVEQIEQRRKALKDQQFGQGEGGYSALYELPEDIHNALNKELTPEERQEFARLEHRKWFANTFPQFRLPDEV